MKKIKIKKNNNIQKDDDNNKKNVKRIKSSSSSSSSSSRLLDLLDMSNPNPIKIGNYTNKQKILLVGEGDFTFASSLASKLGSRSNIVATSYDKEREVKEKYPETSIHAINALKMSGALVFHGIDATRLNDYEDILLNPSSIKLFDVIVFNFPHVGGSTKDDIKANQNLLKDFFTSCNSLLASNGEIHITLRTKSSFYSNWNVEKLAKDSNLKLKKTVKFDSIAYKELGYQEVRTHPGALRDAPSSDDAITYIFCE
ncbi:class I SAM-dependent methyltransferase [Aestuariivirga sp.]|uniref:class I SAM-dependent methyltransferase n=1 Tax=Aestuariivirga sp. TaxID=2650926 RepID=UPI0039E2E0EB